MNSWLDFDINQTIRDFDYTRRAAISMNRIMDSGEFEDMDAEMIFSYLANEMEVVLFPDYLKRYIYQKLEIREPFQEVSLADYVRIISTSFTDNNAPYSFTPTTTKKTAMIKLWLTQSGAKRSSVFALGFGLRMTDGEVSEFLTKALKEGDFDFSDPQETIYWYCYKHDLPYSYVLKYKELYEEMEQGSFSEIKWNSISQSPQMFLLTEQNLTMYLALLKAKGLSAARERQAFEEYEELYARCCEIISDMYNEDSAASRIFEPGAIRPADLEKVLCSGIPLNKKNNLQAMSASCFAGLFQNKRMSRQRISSILNRKHPVERFDLITLLFFIYAQTVEPDWPAERYLQYIDQINEILNRCGMLYIYPANPYEAFILMCLVTDFPLDVYAQVWEKSFE